MVFTGQLEKHVSFLSADEIAQICTPLKKVMPLGFFSYLRLYPDGSLLLLYSGREWANYYIKKKYQILITNTPGIHTWTGTMCSEGITDAAAHFGLHHGVLIEKSRSDFVETIEFVSSDPAHNPIEFCCNHHDLLNRFMLHFKEKGKKLIEKADKERLLLPVIKPSLNSSFSRENREALYELFQTKKCGLGFGGKEIFFSTREFEILLLLAKGRDIKNIAKLLGLSTRTVETHLQNAKNKAPAFSTANLLERLTENLF